MKKKLKVALYDPYLDTLGGGEKLILSILQVLDELNFEITIFWDKDLAQEIKNRFSFQSFKRLNFLPNIFQKSSPLFKKLLILKDFDLFFYLTDGSYFFSTAKKNFVLCMVPDKKLYQMTFANRLKTWNYRFISISQFTRRWLQNLGIKSEVIYPYLSNEFININIKSLKKDKIILSVGRFFSHLHSKKQEKMIILFKKIKHKYQQFKKFKLILAGGLKEEDKNYFNKLKSLVENDPSIIFKPNLSFNELYKFYQQATFYWHFTGYGVDENKHPEMVEHLGITPLEAMATGCITFCYNAGGPKEIIKDGVSGFLFNNEDELIKKILSITNSHYLYQKIASEAQKFVKEKFSYKVFQNQVKNIIL